MGTPLTKYLKLSFSELLIEYFSFAKRLLLKKTDAINARVDDNNNEFLKIINRSLIR